MESNLGELNQSEGSSRKLDAAGASREGAHRMRERSGEGMKDVGDRTGVRSVGCEH